MAASHCSSYDKGEGLTLYEQCSLGYYCTQCHIVFKVLSWRLLCNLPTVVGCSILDCKMEMSHSSMLVFILFLGWLCCLFIVNVAIVWQVKEGVESLKFGNGEHTSGAICLLFLFWRLPKNCTWVVFLPSSGRALYVISSYHVAGVLYFKGCEWVLPFTTLLPDASTKFQENVSGGTTTSSEGVQSSSSNSEGNQGAAHTAKSSNSTAEGAGKSSAQTGESFAAAAGKTVYTTVSQGLQTATASAHAAFQKVREAKVVDSIKTSYSFLREELSNTRPRRKARAAPDTGPPPAENTEVTAVVPVVKKTTGWEKRWETLKEKVLRKKLYASHLLSFLGCFSGLLFLILPFSQIYLVFVSCLM